MSELPDLPPVVRRTRPLPAGGLEAAMAAGARRRHRMLAVAGGTTTALVLVLAATLALPGGGTDSLGVADRPSPAPSPTSPPEQAPQEVAPAPDDVPAPSVPSPLPPELAPPPPDAVVPPPTAPAARGGTDATAPGRPPEPATATAQPTAAPPPPAAARPAYREDTDEDASGGGQCVPGVGACTYTNSNGGIARRGMQAQIWLGHCNGRDSVGDHVYGFDGGQEKEVVVTDEAGAEVFRFSATVRYVEGAHERRLRVGRCLQWTGRWNLVTTDGRPVPAGEYRMTLTVRADRQRYENAPPSTDGGPYVQQVSGSVTVLD